MLGQRKNNCWYTTWMAGLFCWVTTSLQRDCKTVCAVREKSRFKIVLKIYINCRCIKLIHFWYRLPTETFCLQKMQSVCFYQKQCIIWSVVAPSVWPT